MSDEYITLEQFNALPLKQRLDYIWEQQSISYPVHRATWKGQITSKTYMGKPIPVASLKAVRGARLEPKQRRLKIW